MKQKQEIKSDDYHCEHCRRSFVRPASFAKHLCEQKRRWQDRDRPANRIAFQAWLKFYNQVQPTKKRREYVDFIGSAYYLGFLKYGTYCVEAGVVAPLGYVDYLLKENIALDNWASDRPYTKYLIFYLRSENELDAVKRSIDTMLTLGEQENIELRDVFRYVNSNKICQLVCSGKISPWVLYHSRTGAQFLTGLNEDQRGVIFEYIDPERWAIKFNRDSGAVENVVGVLSKIEGL
jgi:hypothetical protein